MGIETFDHVGIKVTRLKEAIAGYEALGFRLSCRRAYPDAGVEVAFLELGGHCCELLSSLSPDSPIANARAGLHHLAYRCPRLADAYVRMTQDPAFEVQAPPSPGAHGRPVFFFRVRGEPALFELVGTEAP